MTVDELQRELLQLPDEDRSDLVRVLWNTLDREAERERYFQEHLRPFLDRYPLKQALAELRSTMRGLRLNDRSMLIDALGHDLSVAWDDEIQRRIEAHERGEVETFDAKAALVELRARLAGKSPENEAEPPT